MLDAFARPGVVGRVVEMMGRAVEMIVYPRSILIVRGS